MSWPRLISFAKDSQPITSGSLEVHLVVRQRLFATPPLQVDRLILEAVYPTIEIATNNRISNWLGPMAPAITPLLLMQLYPRLGVAASSLHPIDYIAKVTCPILIMSGEKDSDTRPEDTRLLFSKRHHRRNSGSFPRLDMSIFIPTQPKSTNRASWLS